MLYKEYRTYELTYLNLTEMIDGLTVCYYIIFLPFP